MKSNIKKLVISKTIIFIIATMFISVFKGIFGDENALIGVSSFIAMLMFMEKDLTANILKYTFSFVGINLIMGVGILLVNLNMFIGIPINFILVFLIGYYFCNDLKKPVYLPFMLQYVFLLSEPINISQQPQRLLSLFVGALLIMVPQLLFNMKKLENGAKKTFKTLSNLLIEKIQLIMEEKDTKEIDAKINSLINSLHIIILQRKDKNYDISNQGEATLNILVCLQKLNEGISIKEKLTNEIISYVKEGLSNFDTSLGKETDFEKFILEMKNINEKYKNDLCKDINSIQVLNSFKVIEEKISELNAKQLNFKKVKKRKFNIRKFIEENKDGVGFSYGIRAGIGITITYFLTQVFQLQQGVWMTCTIYSLVNPIYEVSRYKTKDRVIATFFGGVTVVILLTIFKGEMARSILLLFVGYIMTYVSQYKYTIFFATICIVAITTGTGSVTDFALQRFIYVVIGLCIALILNRFVLRKNLDDINESLEEKYKNIIRKMLEEIYNIAKGKKIEDTEVEKNFLTTSLIENKIKENYELSLVQENEKIELKHRILAIDTFNLYISVKENIENIKYSQILIEELESLREINKKEFNVAEYTNKIRLANNIHEKIVYANIYEVGTLINKVK